jgi:hypothetical protein
MLFEERIQYYVNTFDVVLSVERGMHGSIRKIL